MKYRCLLSRETLQERIVQLGQQLRDEAGDQTILLLGVLKGAIPFMTELLLATPGPVEIDTLQTSSYVGTASSGTVAVTRLPDIASFDGYFVVLVEDIVDTGRTIAVLMPWLHAQGATDARVCTLLDKPARRVNDVQPDYVGFTIEDTFVIGFGLDLDQRYRNLPYVAEVLEI